MEKRFKMRKVIPRHRRNLIVLDIREHRNNRNTDGKSIKDDKSDKRQCDDDPAAKPFFTEFFLVLRRFSHLRSLRFIRKDFFSQRVHYLLPLITIFVFAHADEAFDSL